MPLRKDSKRRSDGGDSASMTTDVMSNTTNHQQDDYEEEEEEETQDAWLKSLGVENSEIKRINYSQVLYIYIIIIYCLISIQSNVAFCFRRG